MRAPRAEIARSDECLGAELVLDIKRPALHVGGLKILVDAADILNRKVDGCSSRQRIVERRGINDYLLLEWRVPCDQICLLKTER